MSATAKVLMRLAKRIDDAVEASLMHSIGKLTDKEVIEARILRRETGMTYCELAAEFGNVLSEQAIRNAVSARPSISQRTYKHLDKIQIRCF